MVKFTLCLLVLSLAFASSFGLNQVSVLKNGLLSGYDKTAKPKGQVEVTVGLNALNLDLCAHKQVCHFILVKPAEAQNQAL